MTYDLSRKADARVPVTAVELYLDDCAEAFGASPCTASGNPGTECYNTFATCQDFANFNKSFKTYRFYEPVSNWPIGETGYPCLVRQPKFTPCQIDPKGSLGRRGAVSVTLHDFVDDDVETDPYVATRTYDPESQGTFFGKLKARTPYYKGRLMKVREGYINSTFSWGDFKDRLYVIESIDYDQKGRVTIHGKDLLKLTESTKSVAPAVSTGTLSVAMSTSSTDITLQTGEGADYDSAGYVTIGDEVIQYTSNVSDVLSGLTRESNGSTLDEHDEDDSVQQCLSFSASNVIDIIHELLTDYAGIDETYLPYDAGLTVPTTVNDEWDDEKASWLSSNTLTHLITEPTGVDKLLQELCVQNLIYMWFDEVDQEVKLRAIAPELSNASPQTFTDDGHIIAGSIDVKDNVSKRISQIWVFYDQKSVTGKIDDPDNYKKIKVQVDTESEGVNAYDEKAIRIIYANWLDSSHTGLILTLAGRLIGRYAGVPKITNFKIDMKDADLWTGGIAYIDSIAFQGADGANQIKKIQVLKASTDHDKQEAKLQTESWDFEVKRYGYIAPNTVGDYTSESTANQNAYGFISQNDGLYTNGDAAHLIA